MPARQSLTPRIDWRATFYRFCEAHGGDPVEYGGRLIFRDGWGYARDYKGPEFPPPADAAERNKLIPAYWSARERIIQRSLESLKWQIESLDEAQIHRSTPLQVRKVGEKGGPVEYADLDLTGLRGRVEILEAALRECQQQKGETA